jgi:hypothetical protein
MHMPTAADKSINTIHPVLAGVAADAAARVWHVLAAEVDDGGGGLHDVSTVALRLHANGHSGLVSTLLGFSSMICRTV